jgi:carboxypeptidase family protein
MSSMTSTITSETGTLVSALTRKVTLMLVVTLGVLLFSLSLFSQGNFGRILGIVTDQTGGVISGATVTVIDTQRGVARTLTTDNAGEYNVPTLNPSTYTVRVEAKGFKKLERQNIVLEVGKEVRVDVTVQPGEQTQTITVTESIPLVETTNATLGGALSNGEINDLPLNGRNYQNLLGLRPGVMLQPGGSPWTQSTNNIRPDETVWMVDGILNVNFFDNRPIANMPSPFTDMATILPIDAIQEFNVEENPKAEYGWKPGAVVNAGVRSGTNTLHGSAYAFGRSDAFDARNFFNPGPDANGTCVTNPTFAAACTKAPAQLKQFGGVVGGPIKKDKLFFFGGYEGIRSFLGNTFPVDVPETASVGDPVHSMPDAITALQAAGVTPSPVSLKLLGCTLGPPVACTGGLLQGAPSNTTKYLSTFPNNNVSNNYVAKIDYAINDKNRINGMLLTGHYHALGEDHASVNAAWGDNVIQSTWTVSGNWVYTPSSRLVNEARFGYNRTVFIFDPADAAVKPDGTGYPINTGAAIGGFPTIVVAGFNSQAGQLLGSQGGRPLDSSPNPYWDVQDSVSYLLGKHALKFGGEFTHIEGDADAHDQRGRIFFFGGNTPQILAGSSSLEDFFAGNPTFGALLTGNPNVRLTWTSTAGFIQDDWRLTPKLTINMGLRYSYVTPMKEVNNQIGTFLPAVGLVQQGQSPVGNTLWKPEYKDFSPRLGFAWDVNGKGTTVVRGGASIIYSTFAVSNFVANPGAQNVPGGANLTTVPTGACTTNVSPCPQTYGGNIAVLSARIFGGNLNWNGVVFPQGLTYCTANAQCNIAAVDPNLKNPYLVNYNFGVQHAFGNDLSLEVGYVGNHGYRLTGQRDLNQAILPAAVPVTPYGTQYPYLAFINQFSNFGRSNYNSLQATLTKRVTHGLSFTAGYTYGHGIDAGSLNRFNGLPQDSTNPGAEYGNSDFDTRHRFTLEASYAIPGKKGFGQLLEGWKLNGILTVATGQPWWVIDSGDNFSNTSEFTDRWDFFGNPKDFVSGSESFPHCSGFNLANINDMNGVTCTEQSGVSGIVTKLPSSLGAKCVAVAPDVNTLAGNPAMNLPSGIPAGGCYVKGNSVLVPPVFGTFGTMGRNLFFDPGFKNLDFSVFKNFTFKERFGAQFRVEFFNLFNHPNLANPYGGAVGSNIGDDASVSHSFGCGCGTPDIINGNPVLGSGGARVMQLGLKLTF